MLGSSRRTGVCAAATLLALVTAAPASAHGRHATVALDYRLTIGTQPQGIGVAILDGDRSLRLDMRSASSVYVLGDLGERMLRFGDGVSVNLASPTAQADRLIVKPGRGWRRLSGGRSFSWHEHRLAPPPYVGGRYGRVADWSVPLLVDGRRSSVSGTFERVARPRWWAWLGATLALVAVLAVAVSQAGRHAAAVTLAAFAVAAGGVIACQTAFVLRDSPTGHLPWVAISVGGAVAAACIGLVAASRGVGRAYLAGAVGIGASAMTLPWFGVFFHGAVIAALPANVMRTACAVTLGSGLIAVAGALSIDGGDAGSRRADSNRGPLHYE